MGVANWLFPGRVVLKIAQSICIFDILVYKVEDMQSGIIVQMLFLVGGGSAAPQFPNFFNPFGNFPFQQPAFPTFSSSYFPFNGYFPFFNTYGGAQPSSAVETPL